MKELTKQEFLDGYAEGYITDIIQVENRIYGKDPRGMADQSQTYDIVYYEFP